MNKQWTVITNDDIRADYGGNTNTENLPDFQFIDNIEKNLNIFQIHDLIAVWQD